MTPTQSPTLASQATAELPELPEPDIIEADFGDGGWADCGRKQFYSAQHDGYATRTGFTADQMNAHYLAGVEAGRASRAQSEWISYELQRPTGDGRRMLVDSNWGVREAHWVARFQGFQDASTSSDEGMFYDESLDGPFIVKFWREHPPAPATLGETK